MKYTHKAAQTIRRVLGPAPRHEDIVRRRIELKGMLRQAKLLAATPPPLAAPIWSAYHRWHNQITAPHKAEVRRIENELAALEEHSPTPKFFEPRKVGAWFKKICKQYDPRATLPLPRREFVRVLQIRGQWA